MLVNLLHSRGVVLLERRIIVFAHVDVTVRGRDECHSSEGRTQPRYFAPVLQRVYGVGGLLKNHHYLTVTELVVSLKTTELAATAATAANVHVDAVCSLVPTTEGDKGKLVWTNASSILLMDRASLPDWRRLEAPLKSPATKSLVHHSTDCKQQMFRDSAFFFFCICVVDVERHHGKREPAISRYPPEQGTGDAGLQYPS